MLHDIILVMISSLLTGVGVKWFDRKKTQSETDFNEVQALRVLIQEQKAWYDFRIGQQQEEINELKTELIAFRVALKKRSPHEE